jgi:hypothetical protein
MLPGGLLLVWLSWSPLNRAYIETNKHDTSNSRILCCHCRLQISCTSGMFEVMRYHCFSKLHSCPTFPALSPASVRYVVQDWRATCASASAAWIMGNIASFLVARRWASYRASDGVSEQRLMNFGAITQAACIVSILALLLRAQSIHAQATRA